MFVLCFHECFGWKGKNQCSCGKTFTQKQFNRVQGGSFASENEFPWQVYVQRYHPYNDDYRYCGGALISRRHVLTAGHCVKNLAGVGFHSENLILVKLGSNDRKSREGKLMAVSKIIPHPDYDSSTSTGPDFAILKLTRPVRLSKSINTVCFPTHSREHYLGKTVSVSGWGKTSVNGSGTRLLKTVNAKVIGPERCQSFYKSGIHQTYQTCIEKYNNEGVCKGDSGGAYTVEENGRRTAIGVVSKVSLDDCSNVEKMAALTMDMMISWISQNTKGVRNSKCEDIEWNFVKIKVY